MLGASDRVRRHPQQRVGRALGQPGAGSGGRGETGLDTWATQNHLTPCDWAGIYGCGIRDSAS